MKTKILIPGALLALLCATSQAQLPMVDNTVLLAGNIISRLTCLAP